MEVKMMKRGLFVLISLLVICSWSRAQSVSVRPVFDLDKSFIMGVDVSMLDQLESAGAVYYDEKGKAADCLAILKAGGVNWIRLRIWNDPVNKEDVIEDGRVISRVGDPVGGGNDDLAAYIRIAKRAKKLGLQVEADFHYSDFWADPGKQTMPFAWKGLSLDELKKALYDYTSSCLKAMRADGAAPDMVQVGNEVDGGFLWPLGKLWQSSANEAIGGEEGFVALLKEAIRAIRDSDKRIRIMIHISNGVDFDVIGLSFYPYWHGKISDLTANMSDLASRYGKDLIVAETAYAWTLEPGDSLPNSFGPGSDKLGGYKATVQGQASAIGDIIAAVAGVRKSRGVGIFYWEPDWIPVPGVGWRTGDGSSWENQALFDYKGKALPSLNVFKLVAANGEVPDLSVTSVEDVQMKVAAGNVLKLPTSTLAAFSDDSFRPVQVKWVMPDPSAWKSVGKLEIKGSVWGYGGAVTAYVEVVADVNLISDSSFESGACPPIGSSPGKASRRPWSRKIRATLTAAIIPSNIGSTSLSRLR
jgi:arabinogalactan endo-1,4-beta-galactosidase